MRERRFQFREMTPGEADEYLRRHLDVAEGVIAVFRERLVTVAGVSPGLFDYSEETLSVIWEAVKPLYAELDVDRYGFGGDDPPLWYHPEDPASARIPYHLWWIRDGLIHYVSRCLMTQSPALWWDRERDRHLYGFNEPTIVGFQGASMHPIGDVSGMASGFRSRGYFGDQEPVDRFMSGYRRWAELAPGPGEAAVPRVVDDRYELEDVVVGVAVVEEIQYETIEPDRPEDWEGTWSVWLPEGIDVVCGSATKDELEAEIVGRGDVSRVGWADEDTLLVDAPDLAAVVLRDTVVAFLNNRRI